MPGGSRAPVILLAFVASVGWPTALRAGDLIDSLLNQPVTDVRLEIAGRPETDAQLTELVETRTGSPLRIADVRETLTHLFGLGRFQDIRVHAARSAAGVSLRYELIPLQSVRQIEFTGSSGVSDGDLRRAVVDRFGTSPPIGSVAEAARTLEALYQDHGYMNASVRPEVRPDRSPDQATLVFHVVPGPRTTIARVNIEGDPLMARTQFLDKVNLEVGRPYERPDLVARLAKYTNELRHREYYEARLEHTAAISEDGQTAGITVTAVAGPHFQVVFEGDPLPSSQRDDLVPVEQEGSADEDLLEDSNRRIEAYLQKEGYRDATSENSRTGDEREQKIVFTIHRGIQYRIGDVSISGNAAIETREVQSLMRVASGEPYVQALVNDGIGRIAEAYHRRGYLGVNVKADVTPDPGQSAQTSSHSVTIAVQIIEGTATTVAGVTFRGNAKIDSRVLAEGLGLQPGQPFYQPQLSTDLDTVVLKYLNRGYQTAAANADVTYSDDRSHANVAIVVQEGQQVFVDHILIVGNSRTRPETILRELTVKSGQPLGLEDVIESQRRLSALGLFRRVRITELRHAGSETERDLLVSVEEAALTTIGYGVGVEGGKFLRRVEGEEGAREVFEAAPRGFFEIGRRNLWGKNRSVNLFTRVSFRRDAGSTVDTPLAVQDRGYGFNEYRALFTYREPKVFGSAADAFLSAFAEQGVRSSFNFDRKGVRAELARRFARRLTVSARYDFDTTRLFDQQIRPADKPLIDRLFPEVRLSSVSGSLIRDTRDDALDPGRGALVGLDGQLAARAIGSEVGFFKTFLQAFVYRRLPGKRRIVLAGGARLGLANGFPQDVTRVDDNGQPVLGPDGQPLTVVVEDIPASERFFAGGDTTVRGFALDRLGTPETFDQDGFPIGGNGLVIFNAELRVPLWRDLGVVGFVDSGNVFEVASDLDLSRIRGSGGFGIRYKSPIGPLRVDLGFKFDRQEFADGQLEDRTALHISLGQAF